MRFTDILYKVLIAGGSWLTILKGLWVTVQISLFSIIAGTVLGALVCALKMCRVKLIRAIATVYIVVLRGSPVLMLLMLFYYGVFAKTPLAPVTVAVITFSLNVAASVAEIIRTSIEATEHGQVEAALTLGFSPMEAFRLVTLPQLITIAKPVYQSAVVNLIQWTSVVGYVAITDLTRVINNISSRTMQPFITITAGMLIYLGVAYIVHGLFALSDRIGQRKGARS